MEKKIDSKAEVWKRKIEEIKNDRKFEELERKVNELTGKRESEIREGQKGESVSNSVNKRMEDFMERKEREDRKNNIIIKGMTGNEKGENLRKKVERESFNKEKIKVDVEVKYVRKIGFRNMIMAKIGTFEQKLSIMKNKKILGSEEMYIENDRTRKEREIQRKIVGMAKIEREKNREAEIKIGHWKVRINEIWYRWNESSGTLERQDFQNGSIMEGEIEIGK